MAVTVPVDGKFDDERNCNAACCPRPTRLPISEDDWEAHPPEAAGGSNRCRNTSLGVGIWGTPCSAEALLGGVGAWSSWTYAALLARLFLCVIVRPESSYTIVSCSITLTGRDVRVVGAREGDIFAAIVNAAADSAAAADFVCFARSIAARAFEALIAAAFWTLAKAFTG